MSAEFSLKKTTDREEQSDEKKMVDSRFGCGGVSLRF
jgi:hypothetical protein